MTNCSTSRLPRKRNLVYMMLALGLSSLLPVHTQAQILKVDKGSALDDTSGVVSGHVTLDFSLNNRNSTADEQVNFTLAKTTGDISFLTDKHIYYFIEDVRYFKSTGGPLLSTGYGHIRANFLRKQVISYELFSQGQYDQGRNLEARFLYGGGVRIRILEKLAAGIGAMQEFEEWKRVDTEESVLKRIPKLSSYLSGRINISTPVTLSLTGYYQTGYDAKDKNWRNRLSGDIALDISISSKLALRMSYTAQYEDRPVISISKYVYTVSNGLKYSF